MKLYKREYQGDNGGFIFKSYVNYESGKGVCYIPEYLKGVVDYQEYVSEKNGYTRQDFEKLCEGTNVDPDLLFEMVDWQSPETLLYEWDYDFINEINEDKVVK